MYLSLLKGKLRNAFYPVDYAHTVHTLLCLAVVQSSGPFY